MICLILIKIVGVSDDIRGNNKTVSSNEYVICGYLSQADIAERPIAT